MIHVTWALIDLFVHMNKLHTHLDVLYGKICHCFILPLFDFCKLLQVTWTQWPIISDIGMVTTKLTDWLCHCNQNIKRISLPFALSRMVLTSPKAVQIGLRKSEPGKSSHNISPSESATLSLYTFSVSLFAWTNRAVVKTTFVEFMASPSLVQSKSRLIMFIMFVWWWRHNIYSIMGHFTWLLFIILKKSSTV